VAVPLRAVAQTGAQTTPPAGAGQTQPPAGAGQAQPPAGADQPPQAEGPASGERTYRGLFGGTAVGPGQPGLGIQGSGYVGYDDNLMAAQTGQTGGPAVGGYYLGGGGGIVYNHPGPTLTVSANTMSDIRQYDAIDQRTYSHSGDVSFDVAFGSRTHLLMIERAGTASLFRFAALPGTGGGTGTGIGEGAAPPAVTDYAPTSQRRTFSDSSVQYSRELSTRGTVTADAGYRIASAPGEVYDLQVVRGGVAYTRQYTRNTNVRIGYNYNESTYGGRGGRKVVVNGLDIGGGYRRPLSFSRRTTISLTGGFGAITQENPGVDPVRYLRATGSAGLQHEFGRSWTFLANYDRGVQFVELFPDPFFVDSATASMSGLFSRRLEFTGRAVYANGQMRLNTNASDYRSYGATTDFTYAFSAIWALSANYSYFHYDFGSRAGLPPGLAPAQKRQSVRLGLRVWMPVFGSR
jgi:hypothetical protein